MDAAGRWAALEAMAACAAILAYIWVFREAYVWLWAPFLAAIFVSHWLRGESPSSLGFRTVGLGRAGAAIAPWVLCLLAVLLVVGVAEGTVHRFSPLRAMRNLALYLGWGVVQQYLLNGYFLNRLRRAFGDSRAAIPAALMVFRRPPTQSFPGALDPGWRLRLLAFLPEVRKPVGAGRGARIDRIHAAPRHAAGGERRLPRRTSLLRPLALKGFPPCLTCVTTKVVKTAPPPL